MNNRIYAFDIFDTVITRLSAHPTDLFIDLGKILIIDNLINISAEDWQQLRIKAEKKARDNSQTNEVTIHDIYRQLAPIFNWSSLNVEKAIQKEIDLERVNLFVIPETGNKIRELHQNDQSVIYLSDMYLPAETIQSFLRDNDLWKQGDKLYVSGEIGINKASGKLFNYCLAKEGVQPQNLHHCGDNIMADFKIPKKLGIQSTLFAKAHLNRYEQLITQSQNLPKDFSSLLAGISRLSRLQFYEDNSDKEVIWDTSVNVTAPLLFGFVYWCLTEANKQNIKRLYFVARDGQILLKIAQIICKNLNINIECRYLYGSRQAWHFPAIQQIGEKELDWIFDSTEFLSIESVLKRVNLELSEVRDLLEKHNWNQSLWSKDLEPSERNEFKKLFQHKEMSQIIINNASEYRKKIIGYFQQEGLCENVKFAIVDIGWNGRLQRSLSEILLQEDLYPEHGIYGYYFGLSQRLKASEFDQLYAYFSDPESDFKRESLCHRALIELFVSADHGSTISFDTKNNQYVPVLRSTKNTTAIRWGLYHQQQAIIEFSQQITQQIRHQNINYLQDYLLIASEILLSEFIHNPSLEEAKVFGTFSFAEDQNESKMYQLAPEYDIYDTIQYFLTKKHKHNNVWYQAVVKRNKIINLSFKLRKFLRTIMVAIKSLNHNSQAF